MSTMDYVNIRKTFEYLYFLLFILIVVGLSRKLFSFSTILLENLTYWNAV